MFPYILAGCAVSSVVSALLCLVIGARLIKKFSRPLSLVAVGFLITLAVSHIIPEAMEEADPHKAGIIILVAILFLTFFEMFFFSTHHDHCEGAINDCGCCTPAFSNGVFGILFGSALHNFCDGLVIASAFLASPALGFAVTIAVLSHEIAHELGDYAIMLESGLTTKKAYIVNLVAFSGCVLGGILGYFILSTLEEFIPYALALSGASFIYVSLSDLLPRLRKADNKGKVILRFFFILVGVVLALVIASHD